VFPNRINGVLFFFVPGEGNFRCSATVQGRGFISTAGHCVHKGFGGLAGFHTNFMFWPAFRSGAAPFNTWPGTFVFVTNTWATGGGGVPNAADYALVELGARMCSGAVRFIGNCIGFAGFQTGSFRNEHITQMGYPCNIDNCNIMHRVDAEPHRNVAPNNITIGSDARGGSSGGGWYQNYGEYGAGQPTGLNSGINRIRAVTSFLFTDEAIKELGASILDSRFVTLRNQMCAHRAGNC
jgi:V8-like Glu-specific endopeptidase